MVYWSDWSDQSNSSLVTWSTSDPSIATINSAGILTAVSDGTVKVRATVAQNTQGGTPVVAEATVVINGQADARYVTDVRIAGPDGAEVGTAAYVIEEPLSTAQAQFYALVDVFDPATGATQTYSTRNGSIAAQTGDIADITWYVGDSAMAAVDSASGLFRPSTYGITMLFATSSSGFGNAAVTSSITVNTRDPEGGEQPDGYFPQSTITVKAYYELYPPDSLSDEDSDKFVINKTFTIEDIEALGTTTQTYTALGAGAYYTITGRGAALSSVLSAAGVNLDGVSSLSFGTADNIDRSVSYSFIFGTDRYYYPNIDINKYTEAQQVYPMLALESVEVKNGDTMPNYNMTEATRFRLLFGSTPAGGTSQYQIKWINTLYVKLAGGPEVKPDDEDPGGGTGDEGVPPAHNESDDEGGSSNGGGGSSASDASVAGAASGVGSATATASDVPSDGADENRPQSSGEDAGDASDEVNEGSSQGAFSVYQVMNKNDSDTETTIDPDNPLKRYAAPLGVGVLAAGGVEAAVWYRRQTRAARFA